MIIKEHFPKTAVLKKRIHSYYFIYGDQKKCSYIAFPNTIKSILIGIHTTLNYTNNRLTTNTNTTDCKLKLVNNLKANTLSIDDKAIILQINFSNIGLCHFVKSPISVLDDAFQKETLVEQLKSITKDLKNWTEESVLTDIEEILTNLYEEKEIKQLEHAIQLLETSSGIKNTANEVGMNYRTLHRHFKKYMGIKPSMYQRIFRLQNVLLTKENALNTFYDASHFVREFKFFTGYTPNEYQKNIKKNNIDFYYEIL